MPEKLRNLFAGLHKLPTLAVFLIFTSELGSIDLFGVDCTGVCVIILLEADVAGLTTGLSEELAVARDEIDCTGRSSSKLSLLSSSSFTQAGADGRPTTEDVIGSDSSVLGTAFLEKCLLKVDCG